MLLKRRTKYRVVTTTPIALIFARTIHPEGVNKFAAGCNPGIFFEVPELPSTISLNSSPPIPKPLPPPPKSCRSTNGDVKIVYPIAQAMENVRMITTEEERTVADEIEITKGMRFDYGYVFPSVITAITDATPSESNSRSASSCFRRRGFPWSYFFILLSEQTIPWSYFPLD